jgi:nitrite reductase/ring-hydroxylating ferredoxin subunit
MPGFVKLATLDDLPPGTAVEVAHDGRIVALFNLDGMILAIDGICPHQGGPLVEGEVKDGVVTCPWHGWRFDLRTGQSLLSSRVRQPVYEVRIEGRDVLVAVP